MSFIQIYILIILALIAFLSSSHKTQDWKPWFLVSITCFTGVALISPSFSVTVFMQPGYEPVVWMDKSFVIGCWGGIIYTGFLLLDEMGVFTAPETHAQSLPTQKQECAVDGCSAIANASGYCDDCYVHPDRICPVCNDWGYECFEAGSCQNCWDDDGDINTDEYKDFLAEYVWEIEFVDQGGNQIDDEMYFHASTYTKEEVTDIAIEHWSELSQSHDMPSYGISKMRRFEVPQDCIIH